MNELQQLRDEITQLNAALTIKNGTIEQLKARVAEQDRGWIECSKQMPPSGQTVLAFYLNTYGMERRIRAQHVDAWTIQADDLSDPDTECFEYSEQEDAYYLPAGWYECIDNWGDYSSIAVNEGIVTHWMPLPAAPAPQAEQFCDGHCTWLDHHPDCVIGKE